MWTKNANTNLMISSAFAKVKSFKLSKPQLTSQSRTVLQNVLRKGDNKTLQCQFCTKTGSVAYQKNDYF